jgi:hypothetical protein
MVACGVALLFLYLSWLRGCTTIRLVVYGSVLVLGEGYLIVLFADLKWPRALLYLVIVSWGMLLGSGVWYRQQRQRGDSATKNNPG